MYKCINIQQYINSIMLNLAICLRHIFQCSLYTLITLITLKHATMHDYILLSSRYISPTYIYKFHTFKFPAKYM